MYRSQQPDWTALFGANDQPDHMTAVALAEARVATDAHAGGARPDQARTSLAARVRSLLGGVNRVTEDPCACPSPA